MDTFLWIVLVLIFTVIMGSAFFFVGFSYGLSKFEKDKVDGAILADEDGSYLSINDESVLNKPYVRFRVVSHKKQDV